MFQKCPDGLTRIPRQKTPTARRTQPDQPTTFTLHKGQACSSFLQQGPSPCPDPILPWGASCQLSSLVLAQGSPFFHSSRQGELGGNCSRVTAGQNRPHLGLCPGPNVPLLGRQRSRHCILDSPGESGLVKPISQSAPRLSPSSPTPPLQPSPTFVSRQTLHLVPTRVFTVPRFEGIHSAEGERVVILFIRGLQIHVLFTWDEWVGLVDLPQNVEATCWATCPPSPHLALIC